MNKGKRISESFIDQNTTIPLCSQTASDFGTLDLPIGIPALQSAEAIVAPGLQPT